MSERLHSHESQEDELRYSSEETDYSMIEAVEKQEVLDNPENVGLNITNQHLIDPVVMQQLALARGIIREAEISDVKFNPYAKIAEMLNEGSKEGKQFSAEDIPGLMGQVEATEAQKAESFLKNIEALPDGASFRVHPFPPNSPFAMENCRVNAENRTSYVFDPIAMEQIEALHKKANAGDKPGELSVVLNSYTAERGGNIPETPEEFQAYAEMCTSFLSQLGLEASGGAGICIELGNETNVDRHTQNLNGSLMFDKVDFADHADAAKYAHMYTQVASAVKERFPNVEIAVAGTAMFDEEYLSAVINGVLAESGGNKGLIDKISFHPYRTNLEEGATTFVDGKRVESGLSYEEELSRMAELAALTDARFDIGELSFCSEEQHGVSVDMAELHKNSEHAREHGLKTYIWPECEILTYEKPKE